MDYRQKTNRGEYIPAFFEMYLKIDGEIDLNKLQKKISLYSFMNIFISYRI